MANFYYCLPMLDAHTHQAYAWSQSSQEIHNSNTNYTHTVTTVVPDISFTSLTIYGDNSGWSTNGTWSTSATITIRNTTTSTVLGTLTQRNVWSLTFATGFSVGDTISISVETSAVCTNITGSGYYYWQVSSIQPTYLCTVPTTETTITAEKLNEFANIFGTTTVTVGNNIIKSPWQEIGTAVGTMTTTRNGNTNATAVTFDNTKPLSTNLNSVITNMTNNYFLASSP